MFLKKGLTWTVASHLLAAGLVLALPLGSSAETPEVGEPAIVIESGLSCNGEVAAPESELFQADGCNTDPCTPDACDPSQCPCDPVDPCSQDACFPEECTGDPNGGGAGAGINPIG